MVVVGAMGIPWPALQLVIHANGPQGFASSEAIGGKVRRSRPNWLGHFGKQQGTPTNRVLTNA